MSAVDLRKWLVLFIVLGNFAFSIVYNNFQTFDPNLPRGQAFTDSDLYIDIHNGRAASDLRQPYRILVPYLARLVPDPSSHMFGAGRQLDETSRTAFKFAVVNFAFMIGIGVVLYHLNRGFGLTVAQALAGAGLFFSLTHVVRSGGGPVAEIGYWFFLSLAALAVQRQNLWLLTLVTAIGVFAKEQMVWIGLLVLLSPFGLRQKVRLVVALAPAVILYLLWRIWGASTVGDSVAVGPIGTRLWANLTRLPNLHELLTITMAFGLLWIPALWALLRGSLPMLLSRWAWFILALLVFNRMMGLGNVRHATAGFIVVVPLAVLGLSRWLNLPDLKESER